MLVSRAHLNSSFFQALRLLSFTRFIFIKLTSNFLCLGSTVQWEEWYLRINSFSCRHYCPQMFCMVWVNMLCRYNLTLIGPDRHYFPETREALLRYMYINELHLCCKLNSYYCPIIILTMDAGHTLLMKRFWCEESTSITAPFLALPICPILHLPRWLVLNYLQGDKKVSILVCGQFMWKNAMLNVGYLPVMKIVLVIEQARILNLEWATKVVETVD